MYLSINFFFAWNSSSKNIFPEVTKYYFLIRELQAAVLLCGASNTTLKTYSFPLSH
jgi:hypothetical protein